MTREEEQQGYELLALAIVKQAFMDADAIRRRVNPAPEMTKSEYNINKIINFFQSPLGDIISYGHGKEIADYLDKGGNWHGEVSEVL